MESQNEQVITARKPVQCQVQYECHPLTKRFICDICCKLMGVPKFLNCCGKIFCGSCLEKVKSCPNCRAPTTCRLVEDKGMLKEIKSFQVCCPYYLNGCQWTGEITNSLTFEKHIETCERKTVCNSIAMLDIDEDTYVKTVRRKKTSCIFYDGISYEFENSIHDRYICVVCLDLMKCPQLMACCGNNCCLTCIKKWQSQKKSILCPFCPCTSQNYIAHKYLQREIVSFKVYCTNKLRGCDWVGELHNVSVHLSAKCEHKITRCSHCGEPVSDKNYSSHARLCQELPLECPNNCGQIGIVRRTMSFHRSQQCKLEIIECRRHSMGCKERVKRQDMQEHFDHGCKYIPVKCQYCGKQMLKKEYDESHTKVCAKFPAACPNGCGQPGLTRRTLNSHRTDCQLEVVTCTYSSKGCLELIKRQDMDSHLRHSCKKVKVCPYCDQIVVLKEYQSHKRQCKPVECPNGCGKTGLFLRTLSKHRSQCELEVVPCRRKDRGCEVKVQRKDLQHHLDTNCKVTTVGETNPKKQDSIHSKKRMINNSRIQLYKSELVKCVHPAGSCHKRVRPQHMLQHLVTDCYRTRTYCFNCGLP